MPAPTPPDVVQQMREMRSQDAKPAEIAATLGVSLSTVCRKTKGLAPTVPRSTKLPKGVSGMNPEDPERDEEIVADVLRLKSLSKAGQKHGGLSKQRVSQIVAAWQLRTGGRIPTKRYQ